ASAAPAGPPPITTTSSMSFEQEILVAQQARVESSLDVERGGKLLFNKGHALRAERNALPYEARRCLARYLAQRLQGLLVAEVPVALRASVEIGFFKQAQAVLREAR